MNTENSILTLKNGMNVVMHKIQSHVSHICTYINSGSRDESFKNSGAMHLIEHMLFKGTSTRNYLEIINEIESVGGEINAFTSKEETCIYISIHNDYIERAINILSDIFYTSVFPEIEVEKEKDVVIDEIQSYLDNHQENIFDEFEEHLFATHELSRNILGDEQTVSNLNQKILHKIYNQNYTTDNTIISYVGGAKTSTVISLLKNYFSEEKKSFIQKFERTPCNTHTIFSKSISKQTFQAHTIIGSVAPHLKSDLKNTMSLLNNLLGGTSFNSQLNLLLREQNGIAYNIETNYVPYSDTGVFFIYFGTDKSKINLGKKLIFEHFQDIIHHGISSDLLHMYKQQLIGQIALSFDNHVSLMISHAKSYSIYNHIDTFDEITEKISAITPENIHTVTKQFLNPDTLSELIYI